jgi:hypothetical protein
LKLLDDYLKIQDALFSYFGYVEDWKAIPIDDCREYFWRIDQNANGSGTVSYASSIAELESEYGMFYQDDIYTQRFLPKWVYRGYEFTMVSCDPHVDGNKFLRIFENACEVPR